MQNDFLKIDLFLLKTPYEITLFHPGYFAIINSEFTNTIAQMLFIFQVKGRLIKVILIIDSLKWKC